MADNITSPQQADYNMDDELSNINNDYSSPEQTTDPFVAEADRPNTGLPTTQEKFSRTSLYYGDTDFPIFVVNRWQNYFDNLDSKTIGGLYDDDLSGTDYTGFMAPEGFYQTDKMSTQTGFEQERGWINEPFQNYKFKGTDGNLKLYPGHDGPDQNPYSYSNVRHLNRDISHVYSEFKDEHMVNHLAPQYTFTRGFTIDNDNKDRRLTNINFAQYKTTINNQDPVVFGYQLSIISNTSPLFNGAIPEFLRKYSKMSDLKSRLLNYYQFFESFFSLFELELFKSELRDSRVDYNSNFTDLDKWYSSENYSKENDFTNSRKYNNFNKTPYYLRKITGLDKLVEKNGFDGKNNFIDYGTDMITLNLNEDTNLSAGSLIMLYKTLSWSKRSGKKMIPENLLRFDLEINVSETRHFNRVMSDKVLADVPNNYTYYLYECQFVFDKMSHGDSIDMSAIKIAEEGVDISFTYKYSTLKMSTYEARNVNIGNDDNNSMYFSENSIDNGKLNIYAGIHPIGATADNSRVTNDSYINTYGKRNISGKIGDFGNIVDGVSNPLTNTEGKLPSEMNISNFDLSRIRNTVSATIIQPNITDKMKSDIKELYDKTKLKVISNHRSFLHANDHPNEDVNSPNSNVYSSLYSKLDFYNTNNLGYPTRLSNIQNIYRKNEYGEKVKILINGENYNHIYGENVFLLPDIFPIIGFGFNSPFLSGSAYINLGDDNVYYDRFGLSLNGGFSFGGVSLGGNLGLGPKGLSLGGSLGLDTSKF